MPQWLVGEIGYALAIAGIIIIVLEWRHVFNIQGDALSRESLRVYLAEWRIEENFHGRGAIVKRMQTTIARITDRPQRDLFTAYIAQLLQIDPEEAKRLDELDRALAVGTPIQEEGQRRRRRRLMAMGAVCVVLGSFGQMVSTYPKPFGPFCDSKEWKCPAALTRG